MKANYASHKARKNFSSPLLLRIDLEVQTNAHSRQLNVQIPQNTRDSNERDVLATHPFLPRLVLPAIVLWLRALDLATATSAAHAQALIRSATAAEVAHSRLGGEERAASLADPGLSVVRAVEQTVLEEESRAVSEEGVALHFSDANTTALGAALDGLAGERGDGTGGADLVLVVDHVAETLVVDDADVDVRAELLARDAGVHGLVAVVVVAGALELVPEVLDGGLAFLVFEFEGRGVLGVAVQGAGFAGEGFDEHADGHAGGEGVRVDDYVWLHAGFGEGHVGHGPLL